jgi:hypothetical protein
MENKDINPQIFVKLGITQQDYGIYEIFCEKFYPNQKKNVENVGKFSFLAISKLQFSPNVPQRQP